MRLTLFIFSFFVAGSLHALTAEQVIEKMHNAQKKADVISYKSTYELFKGHTTTEVHNSYKGEFYKDQEGTYQRIKNTEFVYGKNFSLQVSHGERAMVLSNQTKTIRQDVDFSALLRNKDKVSMKEVSGNYEITITYKASAANPFSKVELLIRKGSFYLEQLDLFYRVSQDFSSTSKEVDMHQPHLRVRFTEIDYGSTEKRPKLLTLSTYITTRNNILHPAGKCIGYELIDNRIK